jgi:hypothetical protein
MLGFRHISIQEIQLYVLIIQRLTKFHFYMKMQMLFITFEDGLPTIWDHDDSGP